MAYFETVFWPEQINEFIRLVDFALAHGFKIDEKSGLDRIIERANENVTKKQKVDLAVIDLKIKQYNCSHAVCWFPDRSNPAGAPIKCSKCGLIDSIGDSI
jgi:hypothetical protein